MEYGYYLSVAAFLAVVVVQFVPMPVPAPDVSPDTTSDK